MTLVLFGASRYSLKLTRCQQLIIRRSIGHQPKKLPEKQTLKSKLQTFTSSHTVHMAKHVIIGGSLMGFSGIIYYNLYDPDQISLVANSNDWPPAIRKRIRDTYLYLAGSLLITASSAAATFKSPPLMELSLMRNGFISLIISLVALLGSATICQNITYKPGFGFKQIAWIVHCSIMGLILAPICYAGGPVIVKAAILSGGLIFGLSAIGITAPNAQYLYLGAPLAMALGVLVAISIASVFIPPNTRLGASVYAISIYGGLLLFSGFLVYDTQLIIEQAERWPLIPELDNVKPYDPINASIRLYLDTINIFIRIVAILAERESKK